MLKKLVRYGNSNALVLDRAILELLNIGEGSTVKLHTDGTSLIITPAASTSTVSMSTSDVADHVAIATAAQTKKILMKTAPWLKDMSADPTKLEQFQQFNENEDAQKKMQDAFRSLTAKYKDDLALITGNEEFMKTMETLNEQYQQEKLSAEAYTEKITALRYKIAPNLKQFDDEMKAVSAAMGCPQGLPL